MQKNEGSKDEVIVKLRKVLDNKSFQNEKYLDSLDKRLRESPYEKSDEEKSYSMKPKVTIRARPKKEPEIIKVKGPEPKFEFLSVEKEKEQKAETEDIFEIEKVEVPGPRFVEVKPKVTIREPKEPFDEKKPSAPSEELTEWETVEKKEVEQQSPEFKPVEKVQEKPRVTKFCSYCNAPVEKMSNFCSNCGHSLKPEVKEIKPTKEIKPSSKEPELPTFIPVKKVKEDESVVWEPIDIEKSKKEAEEIESFKEEPIIPKENKIEPFKGMESINEDTAILLYNYGFISIDSLKEASIKDITRIKGIKRKTAKKIKKEIETKFKKTDKIIPINVSETAMVDLKESQVTDQETEEMKDKFSPVELSRKSSEWSSVDEFEETPEKKSIPEENIDLVEEFKIESVPRENKIEPFRGIESIDPEIAVQLYDNGFTSLDSLKSATARDLRKKGIKRKIAKKIVKELSKTSVQKAVEAESEKEIESKKPEKIKAPAKKKSKKKKREEDFSNYFIDEDKKEEANKIEQKIAEYEPLRAEEEFLSEDISEVKKENPFKEIRSVDDKIAKLLKGNGINSIDSLNNTNIKDLVKIKGIKRKVAKNIKKEASEYVVKNKPKKEEKTYSREENPFIKGEEDEWESFDEDKIPESLLMETEGYKYGDFTLYEKEIENKNGKKTTIRFFSKAEPEEGKPIELPEGYEVKENSKTGIPYLKKKSKTE